jgi:hypothetical protein
MEEGAENGRPQASINSMHFSALGAYTAKQGRSDERMTAADTEAELGDQPASVVADNVTSTAAASTNMVASNHDDASFVTMSSAGGAGVDDKEVVVSMAGFSKKIFAASTTERKTAETTGDQPASVAADNVTSTAAGTNMVASNQDDALLVKTASTPAMPANSMHPALGAFTAEQGRSDERKTAENTGAELEDQPASVAADNVTSTAAGTNMVASNQDDALLVKTSSAVSAGVDDQGGVASIAGFFKKIFAASTTDESELQWGPDESFEFKRFQAD